ncbi:PREDICTED: twisted gastrulation protein homolog 1-A [Nicrophorus vespilloides]|uniref:Twisted gastrulation protein homolog 1-A n=1 Tax=Nicrophorus vespilloides TaxID=110193 RepID=A0ABM1MEC9_NICVS|nr:PREDICTED: twisted gastrulation protein homolog 1-A [Nicrophorus vespilloides]XP_017772928.1 PREDICTED: twisted gastrulation protein homolog 1-A [Nicrophorus vespilloides]XP_017772929.1 PREDICTED: twisted gastrulation protein homolog 1-A [Nicrophorus vespilloides]
MQSPLLLLVLLGVLAGLQVQACNEAVCGSIVTKCLLTESCKCDFANGCSCCQECSYCLSYLYNECCSCVGMCPKPNDTQSPLNKQSQIEDFQVEVLDLFRALTETDDIQKRWTRFVYPVDVNILHPPKNDIKYQLQSAEQEVAPLKPNITTHNCTVAYMAKCMSWEKCKASCQSMGASSMRWFHDGCCECIGEYCINYGINDSRCIQCSRKEEIDSDDLDSLSDNEKDYGEDDYDLEDDV